MLFLQMLGSMITQQQSTNHSLGTVGDPQPASRQTPYKEDTHFVHHKTLNKSETANVMAYPLTVRDS